MTEEEKKRRALELFAAEQVRLQNCSPLRNFEADSSTRLQASLARSDRQRKLFTGLAQQGITWGNLKATYDKAVEQGKDAMIQLNMGYFYSGMAIAFKEAVHTASTDDVLDFLHAVAVRMSEEETTEDIIRKAQDVVDIDLKSFDTPPKAVSRGSRKDRAAVKRMQNTGITQADLDYEREIGYAHGWNSEFFHSACYSAVVLVLNDKYGWEQEKIETFIERVNDLRYEEISRVDILERAKRETGIDVDGIM